MAKLDGAMAGFVHLLDRPLTVLATQCIAALLSQSPIALS